MKTHQTLKQSFENQTHILAEKLEANETMTRRITGLERELAEANDSKRSEIQRIKNELREA